MPVWNVNPCQFEKANPCQFENINLCQFERWSYVSIKHIIRVTVETFTLEYTVSGLRSSHVQTWDIFNEQVLCRQGVQQQTAENPYRNLTCIVRLRNSDLLIWNTMHCSSDTGLHCICSHITILQIMKISAQFMNLHMSWGDTALLPRCHTVPSVSTWCRKYCMLYCCK